MRQNDALALQLRASGATFDQIAQQLGYANHTGALKAVNRAMSRAGRIDADAARALELDRLDRVQMGSWLGAMQGDPKAAMVVLRVIQVRAKLLGLYAPLKREITLRDEMSDIANQVAAEFGLSAEEIIAEAERILAEAD